jgi:hypothetical protein
MSSKPYAFAALVFLVPLACKKSDSGSSSTTDAATTSDVASAGSDVGGDARKDGAASAQPEVLRTADVLPTPTLCPPRNSIITEAAGPLPNGVRVVSGPTKDMSYYAFDGDNYFYWATQDGAIHRVNLSDGTDKLLLDRTSQRNHLQGIAVDQEALYFLEGGLYKPLGVAKMARDGSGSPTTLAAADSLWNIGVGNGYVYYYEARQGAIMRVSTQGGTPTTVLRNVDPVGMWISGGYAYFSHPHANTQDYYILRVAGDRLADGVDGGVAGGLDGGSANPAIPVGAELISPAQGYGATPVTDDKYVYWGSEKGTLLYAPLAGGAAKVLATAGTSDSLTNDISSVTLFQGAVYWMEYSSSLFADSSCGTLNVSTFDKPKTTLLQSVGAYVASVTSPNIYLLGGEVLRMPR